jgi:hypothetical protein
MRRFRFDTNAVTSEDHPDERLGFEDVFAILRASNRREIENRIANALPARGAERKSTRPPIFAPPTGPVTVKEEAREQLLYLFRTSGEVPWILRENTAQFAGLGANLRVGRFENFMTTMNMLRERMPRAAFEDRLLAVRTVGSRELRATSGLPWIATTTPLQATLDLLAHLLASWIRARTGDPYRG